MSEHDEDLHLIDSYLGGNIHLKVPHFTTENKFKTKNKVQSRQANSLVNMVRTTGRFADENQTLSRKKPMPKITDKGSSLLSGYDCKTQIKTGGVFFGKEVSRQNHFSSYNIKHQKYCDIPTHELMDISRCYTRLGHA